MEELVIKRNNGWTEEETGQGIDKRISDRWEDESEDERWMYKDDKCLDGQSNGTEWTM